jgi:predicted transcriptional regulator
MSKNLVEITSEIVQTQASLNSMSAKEIASSLRQVFKTLQELQKSETEGTDLEISQGPEKTPSTEETALQLMPENSIQNDKVICIECGKEMRQLTQKHLSLHGLTLREYKRKYGFTLRTPLAARSLTKARSKIARKRGLPENLKKFHEARKQNMPHTAGPESVTPAVENREAQGAEKPGNRTKLRKRAKQV